MSDHVGQQHPLPPYPTPPQASYPPQPPYAPQSPQPPYSPQPYGAPYGYGPPPGWAPMVQQTTNGLAVASMVLGIIWMWWLGSILALVFGIIAKGQIRRSNGRQSGDGFATAGIVLGAIAMVPFLFFIVLFVISAASTSGSTY